MTWRGRARLCGRPMVLASVLALAGCRQIAGLQDLAAPLDGSAASGDGGRGCSCEGCSIVSQSESAQSLVVVNGNLYWLETGSFEGNGRLMTVATTGGAPVELASELLSPLSIATDGTSLYFFESGGGTIDKLEIPKGGATTLTRLVTGLGFNSAVNGWAPPKTTSFGGNGTLCPDTSILAVTDHEVYFVNYAAYDQGNFLDYTIERASTAGGPVETLVGAIPPRTVCPRTILPGGDGARLDPIALGIAGDALYWLNDDVEEACNVSSGTYRRSLWRIPLAGGTPFDLTPDDLTLPVTLGVGSSLYILDSRNQDLERLPLSGGQSQAVAGDQENPWALAVRSDFVYWSTFGYRSNDGAVRKVRASGSGASPTVQTLAEGLAAPSAIAVDDTSVYWIDTVCQAIFKVPN
jgi:hypothetical protein